MISEHDIEIIEAFLQGKLNQKEHQDLKDRIEQDPALADQVALIRDLPTSIRTDVAAFGTDLREIMDAAGSPTKATQKRLLSRGWLLAASIAFMVGLFALLYPRSLSTEDLFAAHFVIPEENISVREVDTENTPLTTALEAYSQRNFTLAISGFTSYLQSHPNRDDVTFYKGISLLAEGYNSEAAEVFTGLESTENIFKNAAKWYLCLAYLNLEKIAEAKQNLTELAKNANSRYSENAAQLLKDLD